MESKLKAAQVRWRLGGRERKDEDEDQATDDEKVAASWAKKTECPTPTLPPLTGKLPIHYTFNTLLNRK